VALLVTVRALNTRPVSGLRTLTAGVAELVAVTALNLSHVARLRTLLRDVALLIAVTASHDTLFLALLGTVTFLTAVAADVRLTVGAVAGEVAHLAAVLALHVVHVDGFRALLRHVAIPAAVMAAATTLLERLLAVAGTVADLVTVDALLDDLALRLTLLLLTLGSHVSNLVAVPADSDEAVHRETSLTEPVDILFRAAWPPSGEGGTSRLGRPLEGDGVLLIRDALEVDKGPVDGNLLLLSDEVSVEFFAAEGLLEILKRDSANSLGVGEESLQNLVLETYSGCCRFMEVTHLSDGECLLLFVRSLQKLPGLLGRHVTLDVVQGEKTIGLAVGGSMALGLAEATELRFLVRAVGLAVTGLATATALARELALDTFVSAVRSVVARLVAVVAESRVRALIPRLRAVTREMPIAAAASIVVSGIHHKNRGIVTYLRQPSPSPPACLETFSPR
jgi:hypothetical protein